MKFSSVTVKRLIPDILFGIGSPCWVVRVTLPDNGQQQHSRYFWLSWDGVDREIAKVFWYFSI